MVTCPDDGKTQVPMSINIDDIKVQKDKNHSPDIVLDDTYTLRMKYPSLNEFIKTNFDQVENMKVDDTFDLISSCIDQVYSEEETWSHQECTLRKNYLILLNHLIQVNLRWMKVFSQQCQNYLILLKLQIQTQRLKVKLK